MQKEVSVGVMERLERKAQVLARKYGLEQGDALGTMWVAVLEKAEKDPTFLEQTDGFIAQYGEWQLMNRNTAQNRVASREVALVDSTDTDGRGFGGVTDSLLPSPMNTERAAITRVWVEQALAEVPESVAIAAVYLMSGYGKSEAAALVDRSPSWVSNVALPKMRAALA